MRAKPFGKDEETNSQPRPQGPLLSSPPLKYSKNRGVFCHVTHDEMAFSEVDFSVWWPCLFFLQSETVVKTKGRHFKVFT